MLPAIGIACGVIIVSLDNRPPAKVWGIVIIVINLITVLVKY